MDNTLTALGALKENKLWNNIRLGCGTITVGFKSLMYNLLHSIWHYPVGN